VLQRAELLKTAIEELPALAQQIVASYRRILSENNLASERTGKLGCVVVGGRVHNESHLKSWSDIDLVLTAEKPFVPSRNTTLPKEALELLPPALTYPEYHALGKTLLKELKEVLLPELNAVLSAKLGRTVDVRDEETPDGGLIEIKGFGDQRVQDVDPSIVLYRE